MARYMPIRKWRLGHACSIQNKRNTRIGRLPCNKCIVFAWMLFLGADYIEVEELDLHHLLSAPQIQNVTKNLPFDIVVLSLRTLRFKLPNLSHWTLHVSLDGVRMAFKQKAMPPVGHHILFNFSFRVDTTSSLRSSLIASESEVIEGECFIYMQAHLAKSPNYAPPPSCHLASTRCIHNSGLCGSCAGFSFRALRRP
jgi:hypothetical protein